MSEMVMESATSAIEEAKALAVQTSSARQKAADLWDAIRAFRKQAEAQKEEVCRPLKTAWDDAKKPFDAFVKECQGHESALQQKMAAWDREQDRIARAEQAKIQAKIDAQNAKLIQKAEVKGVEPVLKVAPVVQAPPKSIETQAGTKQIRTTKKSYSVVGVMSDSRITARDERMKSLLLADPSLFVFDWVTFRKLASTGMYDGRADVEITEEYVYSQR